MKTGINQDPWYFVDLDAWMMTFCSKMSEEEEVVDLVADGHQMEEHFSWKYQRAAPLVVQLLVLVCLILSSILFQVSKEFKVSFYKFSRNNCI